MSRKRRLFVMPSDSDDSNDHLPMKRRNAVWDPYCWLCHQTNTNRRCTTCIRSYHSRCIGQKKNKQEPNNYRCELCVRLDTAKDDYKTRNVDIERLHKMLTFISNDLSEDEDFSQLGSGFSQLRKSVVAGPQIINPFDLSIVLEKVEETMYKTTLEFLNDIGWIRHNAEIVLKKTDKRLIIARDMEDLCAKEIYDIEMCDECFYRANTKNKWFTKACNPPHLLVWAKMKGHPYWPAKVIGFGDVGHRKVDVRFFGDHEMWNVAPSECLLFTETSPNKKLDDDKVATFEAALTEANEYMSNLEKKYSCDLVLANSRIQFDVNKTGDYLMKMIPGFVATDFALKRKPNYLKKLQRRKLIDLFCSVEDDQNDDQTKEQMKDCTVQLSKCDSLLSEEQLQELRAKCLTDDDANDQSDVFNEPIDQSEEPKQELPEEERSDGQTEEHSEGKSEERPEEQSEEQSEEQTEERPEEQSEGQSEGQSDESEERPEERPEERSEEHSKEQSEDQSNCQSNAQPEKLNKSQSMEEFLEKIEEQINFYDNSEQECMRRSIEHMKKFELIVNLVSDDERESDSGCYVISSDSSDDEAINEAKKQIIAPTDNAEEELTVRKAPNQRTYTKFRQQNTSNDATEAIPSTIKEQMFARKSYKSLHNINFALRRSPTHLSSDHESDSHDIQTESSESIKEIVTTCNSESVQKLTDSMEIDNSYSELADIFQVQFNSTPTEPLQTNEIPVECAQKNQINQNDCNQDIPQISCQQQGKTIEMLRLKVKQLEEMLKLKNQRIVELEGQRMGQLRIVENNKLCVVCKKDANERILKYFDPPTCSFGCLRSLCLQYSQKENEKPNSPSCSQNNHTDENVQPSTERDGSSNATNNMASNE